MGYDLYWEDEAPQEDVDAYAAVYAEFRKAADARDALPKPEGEDSPEREAAQAVVSELYEKLNVAQPWYYRLNIWGMGECRQIMSRLGMLNEECFPPPFPNDTERFGLTWDQVETIQGGEAEETSAYLRWKLAHDAVSDRDTGDCIPIYKLSDNSGWLVTPEEIRTSLESLEEYGDPSDVLADAGEYWRTGGWSEWVAWLREAEQHGGFRVH